MIVTLPKKIFTAPSDVVVKDENGEVLYTIETAVKGLLFFSREHALIGQIFFTDGITTVAVADGAGLKVSPVGDSVAVSSLPLDNKSDKKYDPSRARVNNKEYIFNGNVKLFNYTLYERDRSQKYPKVICEVCSCPIKDDSFMIRVAADANCLRPVMLAVAASAVL